MNNTIITKSKSWKDGMESYNFKLTIESSDPIYCLNTLSETVDFKKARNILGAESK